MSSDVREIAKLLGSKDGAFSSQAVTLLRDKDASRAAVAAELRKVLSKAGTGDTVFVYLAGHGGIDGGDYYFVTHDTHPDDLAGTGVSLKLVRDLFDRCHARQVFLWLDFCHSGGILARSARADDRDIIRRTLGVVQGEGRVSLAACTGDQSAYEHPAVGHGLFTDALLRGLKGGAGAGGEVTANSLFDFIDREVGSRRQRPMYFGKLTGRVVLMDYQRGAAPKAKPPSGGRPKSGKKSAPARSGVTWVMIDRFYFPARTVRHEPDGTFTVWITPSSKEEADLHPLLPGRYGGPAAIPFAVRNDAHMVRAKGCQKEMSADRPVWTLTLAPDDGGFGGSVYESSYSVNGKIFSAQEIARMRAGRVLLNDPPPKQASQGGFSQEQFPETAVAGIGSRYPVTECVIRTVYAAHGKRTHWRELARLRAVFVLKASGTVEHVLALTIGSVRQGKVAVRFRGRRRLQSSNGEPPVIDFSGTCDLR